MIVEIDNSNDLQNESYGLIETFLESLRRLDNQPINIGEILS